MPRYRKYIIFTRLMFSNSITLGLVIFIVSVVFTGGLHPSCKRPRKRENKESRFAINAKESSLGGADG